MNKNWKPLYKQIFEMYNEGQSPSDIAKYFNTSRTTIKNILKCYQKP